MRVCDLGRSCVGGVLGFAGGREETELVFVLLRGRTGLAAGLFDRSFVGAQTTNFVEFAFYFHFAFQALERTINGFAFFDWDFEHLDSGVMMVICDWGRAVLSGDFICRSGQLLARRIRKRVGNLTGERLLSTRNRVNIFE